MRFQVMALFAALLLLAAAIPSFASDSVNHDQVVPSRTLPPCAQVSVLLVDHDKNQSIPTTVPADLAYECLLTIPLNITSAKAILFEIPLYMNWQSTLDVLKDPPAEYVEKVQAPVDILAGLETISAELDSGAITNDYEFGWRLYQLLVQAHDGHLAYILDVVGGVFQFTRPFPLVSVSEDGSKLPAVFAYYDVLGTQFKNITYTPSPIVKIDHTDVNFYLEELSQVGSLQDRDALYNNLFYNLAQISLGSSGSATGMFSGGGRARYVPLQANTTFEFANGSTSLIPNIARTYIDFTNVTSGEALRKKVVYGEAFSNIPRAPVPVDPGTKRSEDGRVPDSIAATPVGYPVPVVPGPYNLINGFYIDQPGYEDVAVLVVPSFVSNAYAEVPFQAAGKKFLEKAWNDGKTKLILDVQANGGGTILQGYDLFRQIFPDSDPYGGNRFRYNPAFDLIGQTLSDFASQYSREEGLSNYTLKGVQSSYFDYHTDMNAEGEPFKSWGEKGRPYDVNGNNYSAISRWNLTDVYISYQGGINVTERSNNTRWRPENVVLLTDGYCASTCSIFAELLTQEVGVKTVALGGRSNSNKIQAVGGVKGANVFQWSFIQSYSEQAIGINVTLQDSVLKEYKASRATDRAWAYGINVRDAIRRGDDSGVALQFKYEEADCRLYFTPEMTVSAAAIWKAVVDAHWIDSSKCIGNGGYYSPHDRRATQGKTTSLRPAHSQMQGAKAREQFQAFDSTFSIETERQHHRNGFMQP